MHQESVDETKSSLNSKHKSRLIPRGRGFQRSRHRVATKSTDSSKEIKSYREKLLAECGYRSKDMNEKEQQLYIKSLFILRNRKYLKNTHSHDALLLLVSDQDTLFNDGDPKYRNRVQNRDLFSALRKKKRDMATPLKSNPLIEMIPASVPQLDENESKLSELLLERIVSASGNRGVYRWVFSDRHIQLTESNHEEYASKFVCFQNIFGDLPADRQHRKEILATWIKDKRKVKRLTKLCLSEKNPNDIGLLDLTALKNSCFELLEATECKEYSRVFTDKFFDLFVSLVLREYMVQQNHIHNNAVPISDYRLNDEAEFQNFKRRYRRLSDLQSKFSDMPEKAPIFNSIKWWEVPGRSELVAEGPIDECIVNEVITHIRQFFQRIGIPLVQDNVALSARIGWVLKQFSNNRSFIPIIILLMVLSCGRQIAHAMEIRFNIKSFPVVFNGVARAKQRYEELRLLEQLCKSFHLTPDEYIRSAKEYIKFQGKQIRSRDEYIFWCKYLKRKYEHLPAIGFQLCYINYCTQCLYPHYETLCYSSASSLHLGGYYYFLKLNKHYIHKLALQLSKEHRNEINMYKKFWVKPESTNAIIRKVIEQFTSIKIDFDKFIINDIYDYDELKCLIVETVIRIYLCRKSRRILLKRFKIIGGFSLINALYRRIEHLN